jgi:hypothetical protein
LHNSLIWFALWSAYTQNWSPRRATKVLLKIFQVFF